MSAKGVLLRGLMATPRPVWRSGIWVASWWFAWRPNQAIRRWQYNAGVVLGRQPTRRETRHAFVSWGRNLFESLTLHRYSRFERRALVRVSPADRERIDAAYRQGAVVALPHMGSWDLAGAWACAEGMPVSSVAEQLPDKEFRLFVRIREDLGFKIYGHRDPQAVPKLITDVRQGRLVCLVADRDMSRHGVPIEWMTPNGAVQVTMPPGPARIAQRTGAVVLPLASHYLPDGAMRLAVGDAISVAPGREGVAEATQRLADFFSAQVASNVTDWHMLQRFFPDDSRTT